MRPPDSPEERSRHNRFQRRYYDRPFKPNLAPRYSLYLERHVDETVRSAGLSPGARLLEVGCGMGRYTLILARRGFAVEGLDLNPELLGSLRGYDGGRFNIPLHCGDVLESPPKLAGRFDAVIGFFVLHHLHDLDACLEAVARLLRPGGRVTFLEPNPFNALFYLQILATPGMSWRGDGGIIRMRAGRVFRAMRRAGLGRLSVERFGFFPPFLADRPWGGRIEEALERVPVWRSLLPFQLFRGERA